MRFRTRELSLLLLLVFASIPVASASPLVLDYRNQVGLWDLPSGFEFSHVEAWGAGDDHGAPYVIGRPLDDSTRFALFIGSEANGGISWSSPIWSTTVGGNAPNSTASAADLQRTSDGSPVILGNSTLTSDVAATSWRLDSNLSGLVATLHTNPFGESVATDLLGGDGSGNYAGALSSFAGVNAGTALQLLPSGQPSTSALATDRYGDLIVGGVNGSGRFWTKDAGGNWIVHTPQLPTWSDGVSFYLREATSGVIGGDIFNLDLEETVPAVWSSDGSLLATFDLPGYTVSELILDHGVSVALLNSPFFDLPSYVWAEGWSTARLLYGDLLPALADGVTGVVIDFSSGGSQWFLTRFQSGNTAWYGVTDVETAISSNTVPDPASAILFGAGLVFMRRRRVI